MISATQGGIAYCIEHPLAVHCLAIPRRQSPLTPLTLVPTYSAPNPTPSDLVLTAVQTPHRTFTILVSHRAIRDDTALLNRTAIYPRFPDQVPRTLETSHEPDEEVAAQIVEAGSSMSSVDRTQRTIRSSLRPVCSPTTQHTKT